MKSAGRNDQCPCGSGRKYKQCCWAVKTPGAGGADSARKSAELLQAASLHYRAGRFAEAESLCRNLLGSVPGHHEAHYLLALIAYQAGANDQVVEHVSQVISLAPDFAEAHNLLGNAYLSLEKYSAAVNSYQNALSLRPGYTAAHFNLANSFMAQGAWDDAVTSYQEALNSAGEESAPFQALICWSLGAAFHAQGEARSAVEIYQRAIALKPDYSAAYNNLGNVHVELGDISEAMTCFKRALLLQPDNMEACNNLANLQMLLGRQEEGIATYQKALALRSEHAGLHSNYLMSIHYSDHYAQPFLVDAHRAFAEKIEAPLRPLRPVYAAGRDPERCLKVGFVSGDLCTHPVAFFLEGLLANLNRNVLDVVLYYNHTLIDDVTRRLQGLGYPWRSLAGVADDVAAEMVREDGIDLLIDLSGHTHLNRLLLFARKPAPVQVTWLGYFDTTGLQAIDYILGDAHMLPVTEEDHHTERPWRLPESYLCFTPPRTAVEIEDLPALRNHFITFGSFNNLVKLNDSVVALWARILLAVPHSRLFLKAKPFRDAAVRERMVQRFAAAGIAAERLILEGWGSAADHYSAHNSVDIALDPFPFPGVTTSVDALWMGVPVLHLRGDRFIAHAGESILINAGLPEWIAEDRDDYLRLALQMAGDVQYLAALRKKLRSQFLASPLCDAPRFARNFEIALRGMWQQWCGEGGGAQG